MLVRYQLEGKEVISTVEVIYDKVDSEDNADP